MALDGATSRLTALTCKGEFVLISRNDRLGQYNDPRWQKKRLEVLQARNWTCAGCGSALDGGKQLHVHHLVYRGNIKVWEYPLEDLECFCDDCHTRHTHADRALWSVIQDLNNSARRFDLERKKLLLKALGSLLTHLGGTDGKSPTPYQPRENFPSCLLALLGDPYTSQPSWTPQPNEVHSELEIINMAELTQALQGVPETKVEIDNDGDVIIYRDGPIPDEPVGQDKLTDLRREAIKNCCPYTPDNPYYIKANTRETLWDALEWMAHIGQKNWGRSCLRDLAQAIQEVTGYQANR